MSPAEIAETTRAGRRRRRRRPALPGRATSNAGEALRRTGPATSAPPRVGLRTALRATEVVVLSLVLGMATFFAQGLLPEAFVSFANSASGWTLVTVLLLAWARMPTLLAAVLGAASFALLTVGYAVSATLQDLFYDPTWFVLVGVVVGPFIGIATSWLRSGSSWRAAAGTALLSGIGAGEAFYGLTAVAATTSPVYWTVIGAVSLGLLGAMLARRVRGVLSVLLAVGGTGAIAAAFVVAFSAMGAAPLT